MFYLTRIGYFALSLTQAVVRILGKSDQFLCVLKIDVTIHVVLLSCPGNIPHDTISKTEGAQLLS